MNPAADFIRIPASRPWWRTRAVHESGHAVVALAVGASISYVNLSIGIGIDGDISNLGCVWLEAAPLGAQLVCLAAGGAAERLLVGPVAQFDADDRRQMREMCTRAGIADVAATVDDMTRWAHDEVKSNRAWIERTAAALARAGYLDAAAVAALKPPT